MNSFLVTDANTISSSLECDFVFDTNIWLFLYGLQAQNSIYQSNEYSKFFKHIMSSGRKIYLLGTIASEYIHRSLQLRKDIFLNDLSEHSRKEHFRKKIFEFHDYHQWMQDISDEVSFIMDDTIRVDDKFSHQNPEDFCRQCSEKTINYNDMIISNFCKDENLTLLTDDRDFSCEDIRIATANKRLFRAL